MKYLLSAAIWFHKVHNQNNIRTCWLPQQWNYTQNIMHPHTTELLQISERWWGIPEDLSQLPRQDFITWLHCNSLQNLQRKGPSSYPCCQPLISVTQGATEEFTTSSAAPLLPKLRHEMCTEYPAALSPSPHPGISLESHLCFRWGLVPMELPGEAELDQPCAAESSAGLHRHPTLALLSPTLSCFLHLPHLPPAKLLVSSGSQQHKS